MKIQPHATEFINLPGDPKQILESFACVTAGDIILINHEKSQYYIDIFETKPSDAISLIDTDCEVDFSPPLDYKEPEKSVVEQTPSKQEIKKPEK